MADKNLKYPDNVPGKFYVDDSCIDCDLCRETAPQIFRRNEEEGHSYVWKQPETEEEIRFAEEAKTDCPTATIGNDGD